MGRFAMKSRGPGSDALGELTNEQRAALPPRFEAVGEAQASGADCHGGLPPPRAACSPATGCLSTRRSRG